MSAFYVCKNNETPFSSNTPYYKAIWRIRQIITVFKPDIVHAHYATSYGLLGALSKFHPFILSMWGSDIFRFPRKSFLHKAILKHNFKKADKLLSTSKTMAVEANKYTNKGICITPFGVDTAMFKPMLETKEKLSNKVKLKYNNEDIVIGTIKAMEEKYGIAHLIKAFSIIRKEHPGKPVKLLIVGDGSQLEKLKLLVKKLDIKDITQFTGFIKNEAVPIYHNLIDVPVYPSTDDSESFGVSALEASACGKAVVASNVGGLSESEENGVTAILVPPYDVEQLAEAIEKLILETELRKNYGNNGRKRVQELYEWDMCVKQMMDIYEDIMEKKQNTA